MNNVYRLPDREDPTAAACEWLSRIDRGLTEREERDLRDWLAADPRRTTVFMDAAGLWDRMDSLSRLADLFPKSAPRRASRARVGFALAASVLLVVMAASIATREPASRQQESGQVTAAGYQQLFETAVGEQSTVRLPDGSEVTLNTNSRVSAEFREHERRLTLESGEIYVKVAHDAARPLKVFAGDRIVRAVGTEFSVEITADQHVEVIVTEGKVLIGVNKARVPESAAATLAEGDTQVAAGQRVLLGQAAKAAERIDADEIDVKLSWRNGNLIFRGQLLSEALSEIERYTPVEFIITDERLKTIRVAGIFKAGDVDGLLETLRQNFNISYERVGAETIVLKSK